ncbi:hypothetical protein Tco_1243766 [Tanacetum coccineum]
MLKSKDSRSWPDITRLDEGYSSKNYVRKFLRALHPKWRAKVTAIEESKDLTSLSLDELIGNLKVHGCQTKKDSEIVKAKVERKSLALKGGGGGGNERIIDDSGIYEEVEYAMAVRVFRSSLKGRGRFGDKPETTRRRSKEGRDDQERDNGEEDDEKIKYETCLVAHAPNEICLGVDLEPDEWIKDSGCSKHMTGNRKLFSTYRKIEESLNVTFDETPPPSKTSPLVDDDLDEEEAIRATEKKNLENVVEYETLEIDEIVNIKLVPEPRNMTIIGTKWVFRNKLDENGVVSRNKARLVVQDKMATTDKESSEAGTDNRPPMLEESDFESWKIRIESPHPMITVTAGEGEQQTQVIREKIDEEFTEAENNKERTDIQATNILSQRLPRHIFNILNQTEITKEIWENVELLMQGSGLTEQQKKETLFDQYERFRANGNESIHDYFVRFHKLINDMKITKMEIPVHQRNTKFVNNLPSYWGKYVTIVKNSKDISTVSYVDLYTHFKSYEQHAMKTLSKMNQISRNADPLAYIA